MGVGWQAGLILGLARAGVDLAAADAVIGTSAGSVVGLTLACRRDLHEAIGVLDEVNAEAASDPAVAQAASGLDHMLLDGVAEAAAHPEEAEAIRARLGKLAAEAPTIAEDAWLRMFGYFDGVTWPEAFACTAVDVASGRFKVWTVADGVEPLKAVASSCAVPAVFPPVTIGGTRWMDGGMRDMVNADVASGHRTVVAVSCTVLELPEGLSLPVMEAMFAATRDQIDGLRSGGAEVVTLTPGPEMLEVSEWGLRLMDFTRTQAAFEAGLSQSEREIARLREVWDRGGPTGPG